MSDEPRSPELETVLGVVIDQVLESFQIMMPGKVVSYDSTKQSASIQPLIQKAYIDESDKRIPETLPQIHDVPVRHIGGSSGRITVPVVAGDYGMIIFSSLSIARWKLRGGIVDPGDDRRHDLNDCVFEPGLHDFAHVPTTAPTDAIVLHAGLGIKIKLGGPSGTSPVVVETALARFCQALVNAIASLASNPANAQATLALTTLANELFSGGFDPMSPPTSFSLWSPGTTTTEAK